MKDETKKKTCATCARYYTFHDDTQQPGAPPQRRCRGDTGFASTEPWKRRWNPETDPAPACWEAREEPDRSRLKIARDVVDALIGCDWLQPEGTETGQRDREGATQVVMAALPADLVAPRLTYRDVERLLYVTTDREATPRAYADRAFAWLRQRGLAEEE